MLNKMKLKTLNSLLLLLLVALPCWGGVDFNGDGDYINFTDNAIYDISPDFTISAWVKPSSTAARSIIASKWEPNSDDRQYLFEINAGGTLRAFISTDGTFQAGNTVSSTGTIPTTSWTHVCLVQDGTNTDMKLYINGIADGANTSGPATVNKVGLAEFLIGAESNDTGGGSLSANEFTGKITDVAIWDKALSVPEIVLLSIPRMKMIPLQISSSNSQGYFPLDDHPEGTAINGLTFKDQSGNGNHGTGVDANDNSLVVGEEVLTYP